jgi:ketosteroid isomerase-like protein
MNSFVDGPDRSTPAALRAAWLAAIATRDADALRPLLTEDYEVWAHAAPPLQGREAAVRAMRAALDHYHIAQSFEPLESVVVGDWAFERGLERMTVTPVAGGEVRTLTQRALLILRRTGNGQWQFARGMTNGLPELTPSAPDVREA